jgi:hypothetical protein
MSRGRNLEDDDAAYFGESVKRYKYGQSVSESLDTGSALAPPPHPPSAPPAASAGADDEIDPLDAFMASMETTAKKKAPPKGKKVSVSSFGGLIGNGFMARQSPPVD